MIPGSTGEQPSLGVTEDVSSGLIYMTSTVTSNPHYGGVTTGAGVSGYAINFGRFTSASGSNITLISYNRGATASTLAGSNLVTLSNLSVINASGSGGGSDGSNTTWTFPSLTTLSNVSFRLLSGSLNVSDFVITAPNLTTLDNVTLSRTGFSTLTRLQIQNAKLTVDSLGKFLVNIAQGVTNGTTVLSATCQFDFNGGTSAGATAINAVPAYAAALTTITGAGATVTLNA